MWPRAARSLHALRLIANSEEWRRRQPVVGATRTFCRQTSIQPRGAFQRIEVQPEALRRSAGQETALLDVA